MQGWARGRGFVPASRRPCLPGSSGLLRRIVPAWAALLGLAPACLAQASKLAPPEPAALAELTDPRIREASGLVPSFRNPGCYYLHNDSSDAGRVFLIDRQGRTRLTITVAGAAAVDWEDIALAPGPSPGTRDVCMADLGDNFARRTDLAIYRFPEPDLAAAGGAEIRVAATAYPVQYADGPADVEAFCVHPRTGDGYIFTKRLDGRTRVYLLATPWDEAARQVLPRVAEIELPRAPLLGRVVTAADIAPDGRHLALRCYVDGWEWRLPEDGAPAALAAALRRRPKRLALPTEPQGEALCYSPDGRAFLTVSEGRRPVLYETPR
jgi:hypothetical protein